MRRMLDPRNRTLHRLLIRCAAVGTSTERQCVTGRWIYGPEHHVEVKIVGIDMRSPQDRRILAAQLLCQHCYRFDASLLCQHLAGPTRYDAVPHRLLDLATAPLEPPLDFF